jgi:hypothetical protein
LLEGEGPGPSSGKAVCFGKGGDVRALRLCMDKLAPPVEVLPAFDLAEMKTRQGRSTAMRALVKGAVAGRRHDANGSR